MSDSKRWIIISGIMGLLGVALGAFGGHGLKNMVSEHIQEIYKTGVFYHLIHAVVMLAISLSSFNKIKFTLPFFLSGILFFSFSLYVYSISGIKFLTYLTPIGGVLFLVGWGMLILAAVKQEYKD